LPTARLDKAAADFESSRYPSFEGQSKGFLPSDKSLYMPRRGLYAIDPRTLKTQPIYQMTARDEEKGDFFASSNWERLC
jgi:hypothetical protein